MFVVKKSCRDQTHCNRKQKETNFISLFGKNNVRTKNKGIEYSKEFPQSHLLLLGSITYVNANLLNTEYVFHFILGTETFSWNVSRKQSDRKQITCHLK